MSFNHLYLKGNNSSMQLPGPFTLLSVENEGDLGNVPRSEVLSVCWRNLTELI